MGLFPLPKSSEFSIPKRFSLVNHIFPQPGGIFSQGAGYFCQFFSPGRIDKAPRVRYNTLCTNDTLLRTEKGVFS